MQTGRARYSRSCDTPYSLTYLSPHKTNKLYRVYSLFYSLIALLALSPCALGQLGNPAAPSPRYAISVEQIRLPAKVRAHLVKAGEDFSRLDLSAARKEVERALQKDPECAQAFTMRALIELASGDVEGAKSDSAHATELDPNDANAFLALATAQNSRGAFGLAATQARQALRIQPDLWQAHLEVAKALYGDGQWTAALRELDLMNIDFADVHLVRGEVEMRLGRSQEARLEFATFLREAPRDPRDEPVKRILAAAIPPAIAP